MVAAGIWLYFRTRQPRPVEAPEAETPSASAGTGTESPDTLMDAIIALDDLYKDGKLPEEAYLKRRNELKERLKAATGT